MSKISEQDLTLLYYGEHKDPDLASVVAQSEELSARFKALNDELELVDAYQPPERGEDYGAEVWQRISPHLGVTQTKTRQRQSRQLLSGWWKGFSRPRFSTAGVLGLVLAAALAFMLGRNGNIQGSAGIESGPETVFAGIDSERLLASSVSGHLQQLNVGLTEFAHTDTPSAQDAEWAMDMLLANRLYRQSAAAGGDRRLAGFLAGLEPLLIELAYEAHAASNTAHERMRQEVRDDLLFKIRVMNNQLKTSQVST